MTDEFGEQFSVCVFFNDGSNEYVRREVSALLAARAFAVHTNTVAARLGIVERVIITDGGDCVAREWKYGEGLTIGE